MAIAEKIKHYYQKDIELLKSSLASNESELASIRGIGLENINKKEMIK